jgi:crotonobetainyl-CoA:carnitine CoA-transferase CaiB-like acyl-CoA transferase
MGLAIDLSLATGEPWAAASTGTIGAPTNPVMGAFRTADGRYVNLSMLQPGRYWADLCHHLGRDDLIEDDRCNTVGKLMANAPEIAAVVQGEIARRTLAEWTERFRTLEGQWAPVQNSLELGHDPQLRANGYIAPIVDADGNTRELVANPVQFDETPATLRRAPQFAEHTDDILREIGRTDDEIIALKITGAVT